MSKKQVKRTIDVDLVIEKYNKDNPEKKQLDRKSLAKKLGCNTQVFSDWKNGRTPKLIERLFDLMDIGDCQIQYFINEEK